MNSEQKKAVKQTILECRELLEKDIEQVLINYGVYVNKDWVSIRDLVNLSETQAETKKDIEFAIEKLEKGGFDKSKAVKEYIKEVSYTYLNRLAALRAMEVRGLIGEILLPRTEYGSRSFIEARFYEVAREYCKYQQDGGLTYLISLMFDEIGEEIKTLFNTEDEYSFISPSNDALLKVIGLLCDKIDEDSWKQDEVIGWIYQYFNDKEKDDVFDRLYNKKEKIKVEDIPAATQLFTPEWIVKWIVDNSLGALWEEIKHGKREGKRIEDIKLLDPCCGSGHFLVKAYDLFYQMYLEEGKYPKEEIPYKILENNIYGIDIDLRAVQLTALILFIKTKTYLKESGCDTNTKGKLVVNLVCADAILLNGSRLEALKEKHKNNKTILKMIDIIYDEFKDVRLKGSLIQPEKKLFPLFEEYKNRIAESEYAKANKNKKKQAKGQMGLMDDVGSSLEEYKSKRNFTKEEKELMDSLYTIYNEAVKANDITRQLFANEAVKSVRLVDVFMRQYDVVVTNPPYMGKTSMDSDLKEFINKNYKGFENDLYSAFIIRCIEFLNFNGFVGMITQESFMFISSYEQLRKYLFDKVTINTLVHLGPHAFEDISGQKVSTCMFCLENKRLGVDNKGTYIKLNDIGKAEDKKNVLENININTDLNYRLFKVEQGFFNSIDGSPFIYWIPEKLKNILLEYQPLSNFIEAKTGINTGKNDKFVRLWWEVKENSQKKFVPYAKGGGAIRFYGAQDYVVWWEPEEMKKYPGCRLMNQNLFFKEGLTFSGVNSQRFAVRYLPEGFIFDSGGSFINTKQTNIYYLLGFLNTKLANYYLNLFNPTINFKNNDIHRLPFIFDQNIASKIENNVLEIINLKKEILKYNETDKLFAGNFMVMHKCFNINYYILKMAEIKQDYYKRIDMNDQIFDELYGLDKASVKLIEGFKEDYNESEVKEILKQYGNISAVSKIMNVRESIIARIKLQNKIICNKERYEGAIEFVSYIIGCLFNRWIIKGTSSCDDGIIPIGTAEFSNADMVEKIYDTISIVFGENSLDNILDEIEKILNMPIQEYLTRQFYSDHARKYQKRPIYWHICSPKKTFNCFVYYHKLDGDTLYKVKNIYLSQMIDRYKDDLKYYNEQFIDAKTKGDKNKENDMKKRCSDLEEKLDDLYALDKKITEILPYKPDLDRGVLYNIIPLEPILSSTVSTEKEREEYYKEVKR